MQLVKRRDVSASVQVGSDRRPVHHRGRRRRNTVVPLCALGSHLPLRHDFHLLSSPL